MLNKISFRLMLVISLCTSVVLTNGAETCEDKLAAVHASLSAEIAFLKGQLLIKALPEIERLKRLFSETEVDKMYVKEMDDKIKAFGKAFSNEKLRGQSVAANIATVKENLETKQREHLDLISSNAQSLKRNGINIAERGKDIAAIKATVNDVMDTTQYLSDRLVNISKYVEPVSSTSQTSLKAPSFVSQWLVVKSQDENLSELLIEHGLNKLPAKVDVQVKAVSDTENEWIFTGDSILQSDDDTKEEYGGVVYFYNQTHVLLKTPKKNNNEQSGILMTTGGQSGRFMNSNHYRFSEGLVRIRIWLPEDFPDAAFSSGWLPLDITDPHKTFYELSHGLADYPAFVSVQIRSPQGLISEGMGAVMSSPKPWANSGGVLYGYDDKTVRIWTAYISTAMRSDSKNTFGQLLGTKDGWGTTGIPTNLKGDVMVTVWSPYSFIRSKTVFEFAGNVQDSEISSTALNNIDIDKDLIAFNVQSLDGPNRGYLFKGYGSSQAQKEPFGGAIFAYNQKGKIKVWSPNETKSGFLIHINQPYGNGKLNQAANSAAYRVSLLKSKL